jgi:hypothetical protein
MTAMAISVGAMKVQATQARDLTPLLLEWRTITARAASSEAAASAEASLAGSRSRD